jgi:hypothetical protein
MWQINRDVTVELVILKMVYAYIGRYFRLNNITKSLLLYSSVFPSVFEICMLIASFHIFIHNDFYLLHAIVLCTNLNRKCFSKHILQHGKNNEAQILPLSLDF